MAKIKNLQDLSSIELELDRDILEPFDPEYLSNEPYQIPDISSYEKKFFRKVSILENKLKRAGIRFDWDEYEECFRVWKYRNGSEYPTYRYVRVNMDEGDYSFGTENEDLVFDTKVSVVVTAVAKWIGK